MFYLYIFFHVPKCCDGMVSSSPAHAGGFFPDFYPDHTSQPPSPIAKDITTFTKATTTATVHNAKIPSMPKSTPCAGANEMDTVRRIP